MSSGRGQVFEPAASNSDHSVLIEDDDGADQPLPEPDEDREPSEPPVGVADRTEFPNVRKVAIAGPPCGNDLAIRSSSAANTPRYGMLQHEIA